jgi:regulator of nucleoside diphosphate kinase
MIMMHDLMMSLTDAEALAAMLDSHRLHDPSESEPVEALGELLSQARRVPDASLPGDRVAMGSSVTYVDEFSGSRRTVSLAYPADTDVASGRISVLSPIGRALIGRKRGDIVDVVLPGGRIVAIRILAAAPLRQALREAA